MVTIGVTGGIGTGKSLVTGIFRSLGAFIIDADILAREVVGPDMPAYHKIVSMFGDSIIDADKKINRKKLGEIVFHDRVSLKQLEQIIHPEVIREQEKLIHDYREKNKEGCIIVDAPLLIEAGFHEKLDYLIVVSSKTDIQEERLYQRNGMTQDEVERRRLAQLPMEEKKQLADWIIDNNGTREDTRDQVKKIWEIIQEN